MKLLSTRSQFVILAVMLVGALGFASASHAQYGSGGQAPAQQQNPPATQSTPPAKAATPQAPAVSDPDQDKAYKAFTDVKPEATDQQIQLGEQYLQKYPTGAYTEQVYARLVGAYYQKQQFDKMYAAADKATALNPDDVTVLTLVGWVIPHQYDPNDPEADRRLTKAAA